MGTRSWKIALGLGGVVAALAVAFLVVPAWSDAERNTGPPAWLDRINAYRGASGLPPVAENPTWTAGLAAHLTYLDRTPAGLRVGEFVNAHVENPASPFFTPEGDAAGRAANLSFGSSDAAEAIDQWMVAPFHAIGILRPELNRVALATGRNAVALDVIRGLGPPANRASPVLFPGPGATVPIGRFRGELPSPLESCRSFSVPAGLPIILMLPNEPGVGGSATLAGPDGPPLSSAGPDLCVVDEHTFVSTDPLYGSTGRQILDGSDAVLIIPRRPLVDGRYEVTYRQPGEADIRWSFQVGGEPGSTTPDPPPSTTTPTTAPGTTAPGTTAPTTTQPPSGGAGAEPPPLATPSPDPARRGYWLLEEMGTIHGFGNAGGFRTSRSLDMVAMAATPDGDFAWTLQANGRVRTWRGGQFFGHADADALDPGERFVGLAARPDGAGYWVVTDRGRVQAFGSAVPHGDLAGLALAAPVVGVESSPSGRGYHLVAADGGVFTFGDATFHGSAGALPLDAPVVDLVADPDGRGYWLVAADGGVFSYAAAFRGSAAGLELARPVVAGVTSGRGYVLVGADGGLFDFSGQPFLGSLGSVRLRSDVVGVAAFGA